MKFKLLAIAAVLAASGVANAAPIDNGAAGNGGLFFSIWDGSNSYTRNLTDALHANTSIDGFQTVVGTGLVNLTWTSDALFTSFMSAADLTSLQWNVVAGDKLGATRVIETFTAPKALTTKDSAIMRNVAGSITTFTNAVNLSLVSSDSATFAVGTAGYAGQANFSTNHGGSLNFSNAGTLANSSYATGLNLMRIDGAASGIAKSTYNTYTVPGQDVMVYLDGTNALHIAAVAPVTPVPEPENIAMLMAGLGLMGAIARRRNKKSV